MTIDALIFDFDGLILDTETPDYTAWQEIYGEYGRSLSIHDWGKIIGGSGGAYFDAAQALAEETGLELDLEALNERRRKRSDALLEAESILPGVEALLEAARERGMRMAVASSSEHAWVEPHLKRLGLRDHFQAVICRDDVRRTKPDPELFLRALTALGARAEEALVFEDSPNGVRAARAAGIRVVAVPNTLTRQLVMPPADLVLDSLAALPLAELLRRLDIDIREERAEDIPGIREVNRRAFPQESEMMLVDLLRRRGKVSVSLVAAEGEAILGHILFSPVTLEPDGAALRGVGLGPVAVLPERQGQGLGRRLIESGLASCQQRGYDLVVLLGDPALYGRFGFIPAAEFGLDNEYGAGEAFQVRELNPGCLKTAGGLVRYAPEFKEAGC